MASRLPVTLTLPLTKSNQKKMRPQSPRNPPPPSMIQDPDSPLFKAYQQLHAAEEKKPAELKLSGQAYYDALNWILWDIEDKTPKFEVIDGHVFEEVDIEDVEMESDSF